MSFAWPGESNLYYQQPGDPHTSQRVHIIQQPIPQQPTTIIQQLPGAFTPLSQPIRAGRAKEDLIELMMIQNAQMHQVIMNNMTISALSSFGYSAPPPAPKINVVPLEIEDEEADIVYHHHYDPYPGHYQTLPQWQPHYQEPAVRHFNMDRHPASPARQADQIL
ncbi:proline-rich protein 29 isoform X2 [Ambystoma mexicanum]|uniref:proline-rich protein 29 isoform X2 n=1 Tax=Ambystoma mexicanum TaxID=8296 RepID=UPI0037E816B5